MARVIDWAQYEALKAQGVGDREIARRWGIPWGSMGYYKRQRARVPTPVRKAVQSGAVHNSAVSSSTEPPWERLFAELEAIKTAVQNGVYPPVQSSAEPPTLSPEDAKAERWNLWIPRGLRRHIEAIAAKRGTAASKIVQELLWKALGEQ
jgi:hypothetical protein